MGTQLHQQIVDCSASSRGSQKPLMYFLKLGGLAVDVDVSRSGCHLEQCHAIIIKANLQVLCLWHHLSVAESEHSIWHWLHLRCTDPQFSSRTHLRSNVQPALIRL